MVPKLYEMMTMMVFKKNKKQTGPNSNCILSSIRNNRTPEQTFESTTREITAEDWGYNNPNL